MNYRIELKSDAQFLSELAGFIGELVNNKFGPIDHILCHIGGGENEDQNHARPAHFDIPVAKLTEGEFSVSRAFINRVNFSIPEFSSGGPHPNLIFTRNNAHRQVYLEMHGSRIEMAKSVQFFSILEKHFPPLVVSPVVDANIESLLSDLHSIRDSITSESEQALARLSNAISTTHADSVKRIDDVMQRREEYFGKLDAEYQEKVRTELDRINKLEAAVIAREAELNLKEPIGERRRIHTELRNRLLEQIDKFGPSKAVNVSRRWTRGAHLVLIVASIGAFAYFATHKPDGIGQVSPSQASAAQGPVAWANLDLFTYIKLSLTAAAMFGFSIAYIRWEARVADRLSETEFRLRDKAIDIERAAWLVETVEALTRGDRALPDGLLELIGANLFNNADSKEGEAEQFSNFLNHLVGKKGSFEAHLPGGGGVTLNSGGSKPKAG